MELPAFTDLPKFTKTWHSAVYPAIDPSNSELSAKGKVVVITGGGSGIGSAIAKTFAKADASHIVILGRTEKTLVATKSAIETAYHDITISMYVGDVSDVDSMNTVFSSIKLEFGGVDIFINNAAYLPDLKPISESSLDEWWKGFIINVKGSFNATKAFLSIARPDAVLINVTSGITHVAAVPQFSSYATSKLASAKFFEYVQAENPDIRVINVHPGIVSTNMTLKAETAGFEFQYDDVELSAAIVLWASSREAEFLKGKYVWANWDIDELKTMKEQIQGSPNLSLGLIGWP